jgi:hypothetical protein
MPRRRACRGSYNFVRGSQLLSVDGAAAYSAISQRFCKPNREVDAVVNSNPEGRPLQATIEKPVPRPSDALSKSRIVGVCDPVDKTQKSRRVVGPSTISVTQRKGSGPDA